MEFDRASNICFAYIPSRIHMTSGERVCKYSPIRAIQRAFRHRTNNSRPRCNPDGFTDLRSKNFHVLRYLKKSYTVTASMDKPDVRYSNSLQGTVNVKLSSVADLGGGRGFRAEVHPPKSLKFFL